MVKGMLDPAKARVGVGSGPDAFAAHKGSKFLSVELVGEHESCISKARNADWQSLMSLPSFLAQVVIAYEPVWAIGTGVTATAEQATTGYSLMVPTPRAPKRLELQGLKPCRPRRRTQRSASGSPKTSARSLGVLLFRQPRYTFPRSKSTCARFEPSM